MVLDVAGNLGVVVGVGNHVAGVSGLGLLKRILEDVHVGVVL